MKTEEIIEKLNEFILNMTYDLQQDWCGDKEKRQIQLQLLATAKCNLELVKELGGEAFQSSIS